MSDDGRPSVWTADGQVYIEPCRHPSRRLTGRCIKGVDDDGDECWGKCEWAAQNEGAGA